MSIVSGNFVRETSVKRQNKIVQEITRNVANVFSFHAIIAIEHGFQCINIRPVPWEVLKTAAFGLGYQHLPRDLANVNAWKPMFDPYNIVLYTCLQYFDLIELLVKLPRKCHIHEDKTFQRQWQKKRATNNDKIERDTYNNRHTEKEKLQQSSYFGTVKIGKNWFSSEYRR